MEEQVPEMEKIAEKDELNHEIAEARAQIEQAMRDPARATADAAGEVGLVKALWDTALSRKDKIKDLTFKDIKATGAALLSVVPLVGEAGTLAKLGSTAEAGKTYMSVRKLDNAARKSGEFSWVVVDRALRKGTFVDALKNVPRNPTHLVSDPLKSGKETWDARKVLKGLEKTKVVVPGAQEPQNFIAQANQVVLENIKAGKIIDAKTAYGVAKKQLGKNMLISGALHVMHKVDPFPDVPPQLVMVSGLAEFVLPGANILPAVWQLGRNKIEWAKMYGGMALDMGKVVMKRMDGKLNEAKKPDVTAAAGVFV